MKIHRILTHLGLLTAAPIVLGTEVNVNHLAPFADSLEGTAVSINVNGSEALTGVQYLQPSGYLTLAETGVAPGETTLEVFAPPGASEAAISATVDLAADTQYSVSAIGDGVNQPLQLLPLIDNGGSPGEGNIWIRVIHAAPFAPDINATAASIRLDDGTVVNGLDNVLFGQDSGFFELPAGMYDLNVSTADGSQRLIDIAPLDLPAGMVVNVFAVGDGVNQPVGAYAVFADGTAAPLALEPAEPPGPTRVNVAHFAPFAADVNDTAVSVDVNGADVLNRVQFPQVSGYLTLADDGSAPGNTLLEVFAPPGASEPAIIAEVDLAAETDYSVIAMGDGNNQALQLLPLVDDNSAPTDGNIKIRVVHSAPFAVDLAATAVSVRTDQGDVVNGLNNVEFGQTSGFFELPAGGYDLHIATPDGSTRLIDLAPVELAAGTVVTLFAIGDGVNQDLGIQAIFADGSSTDLALEAPFTTLNPGLNGSWYNAATDGQGIMLEVFPTLESVFVAWYTYDTTFADGDEIAVVGDPNHRWLTANGDFDGTTADLTVYLSDGGIFNQDNAVSTNEAGTMRIEFHDCASATLTFSLDGSGLSGIIPITRVSSDSLALCQMLAE